MTLKLMKPPPLMVEIGGRLLGYVNDETSLIVITTFATYRWRFDSDCWLEDRIRKFDKTKDQHLYRGDRIDVNPILVDFSEEKGGS